jgi:hypothetical protein
MTDATCVRCGTRDRTVRVRRWHELDVELCARCHTAVTGEPLDADAGFSRSWALLVAALLVVAAGAAAYLLTR